MTLPRRSSPRLTAKAVLDALIAWLPLVVIFLVFIALGSHQMRSYKQHVDQVTDINNELVAINREMISELREIKEILKDRK